MRKLLLACLLLSVNMMAMADTYTSLWKKVSDARAKDLPKTELQWLGKIASKAESEANYGQLLSAELRSVSLRSSISPDSLDVDVARLEAKAAKAKGSTLKAVYASALGRIYRLRSEQGYGWNMGSSLVEAQQAEAKEKSRSWYRASLADVNALAQCKSTVYEPALLEGTDSKIFYDDLLHVIGMEAQDYTTLHSYYAASGNRAAACLCALKMIQQQQRKTETVARRSHYLQQLDSLLTVYGDLREAGEVALERYQFISGCEDVTVEERYNYINYALNRWGAWPRMNVLRNAQSDLQQPEFNINIGDCMLLPNARRLIRVNSIRNINQLDVKVYRLNLHGDTRLDPQTEKGYAAIRRAIFPGEVQSVTRRYIGQPVWKECQDSIWLEGLPVGVYLIEASTDNSAILPQRELLRVSDLYVLRQPLPDKRIKYVVANATTGKPVSGAHLYVTSNDDDFDNDMADVAQQSRSSKNQGVRATLVTDKNGEAVYHYTHLSPYQVYAYTDDDKACGVMNSWGYYSYYDHNNKQTITQIMTDRSLYRPGQTLHATAIVYSKDNASMQAQPLSGQSVTFVLRDANYKEVQQLTATTDDYGTAAVDFTLPQSGLTGRYSVGVNNNRAWVNVEQYKRPTYEVTFDEYTQAYEAGDTVRLRGVAKTFAGVPVQGARVQWTVTRRPSFWWWWGSADRSVELLTDSATTADDGSFTVRMPMVYPEGADLTRPIYYKVEVRAKVTDGAGESHEGYSTLPLSNRRSIISSDLPAKVQRDSLKTIMLTRQNVAGKRIDGKVSYRFDQGEWLQAPANQPVAFDKKLASGQHQLEAVCEGDTMRQQFIVFSMNDKMPVVDTHDWYYVSSDTFPANGKPVYIQLGTSDEDVTVYYTIFSANRILEQGHRNLSREVVTRKVNYKSEWGDGITISLAWVRRGHLYTHQTQLSKPVPDTRLNLSWKTFRDRLTPGQKEEWTLQVTRPNGKPVQAQVLAAMYDKSLDQILKHQWRFGYRFDTSLPNASWYGGSDRAIGLYGFMDYKSQGERQLNFTHFDPELFTMDGAYAVLESQLLGLPARPVMMMSRSAVALNGKIAGLAASDSMTPSGGSNRLQEVVPKAKMAQGTSTDQSGDSQTAGQPSLRENFDETAFCYPQLLSDNQGLVNIKFTLPESVTTWHFMGLAHDKEMNYGTLESDAVASKTVMVQPNLPRFIRQGDMAQVSVRLFNTSEKKASGNVRLQLIDPDNNREVSTWTVPFTVDGGQTANVTFDIDASKLNGKTGSTLLYIARITAEGRGFSDGEQHWLPLLPSEEHVTTTVPVTQNGAGTWSMDINKLFPKADRRNRLTVEYTNHPAWLMIEALPTVANPVDKDAISLAASIYANELAGNIINASPLIGQTLKQWQMETGKETSLTSSLAKNEDLKTLVLSETPWVAQADNETRQKQQLVDYLNASNVSYRIDQSTSKLQSLQHADGSFGWWPGMRGNTYVTLSVAEILARLSNMGGSLNTVQQQMLNAAMTYLDKKMAREVTDLKAQEKKGSKHLMPSNGACHYLYVCAITGREASADIRYLVSLLEKAPTQLSIYGKANSAIILAHYGKTQTAQQYLQSLSEYTVYKEEMGRYFDTPKALYSWCDYRIPSQVAAIQALKLLRPDDTKTTTEMQRWLLQSKRTQAWDTPINTIDAVYAFLTDKQGRVELSRLGQGEQANITLGGKPLATSQATAGLGYVRTTVQPTASDDRLAIEKSGEGTSWGAVYAQFYQPSSEVKSTSAGLQVKREVISEVTGKPLADGEKVSVGEKVKVRITLVADRDYDFVQVEDKRAACLEPVGQLSGYRWGYYCAPQDNATRYFFDMLPKGTHVIETSYYVDRQGTYESGICTAQCAYSPEFSAREGAQRIVVGK
jgi:hypothetical protein